MQQGTLSTTGYISHLFERLLGPVVGENSDRTESSYLYSLDVTACLFATF